MQETSIQSLGWEDPLEKGVATHSSILAWRIPWTEEPGGLQSLGSQRVRHSWETNTHTQSNYINIGIKRTSLVVQRILPVQGTWVESLPGDPRPHVGRLRAREPWRPHDAPRGKATPHSEEPARRNQDLTSQKLRQTEWADVAAVSAI